MSAVTDKLERPVKAGRRVVDRTFHVVERQVGPTMSTRRAQVISGIVVIAVVVVAAGIMANRRRRPRTLASRMREALPDELVERAGAIKRALG
ncbi:MAG TPA: hypothetical protein VEL12_02980 [Candidatus Nitrosopolaris sp.]|nr:hypothetical protein [Candidatus Nitrosopolaris sp.]